MPHWRTKLALLDRIERAAAAPVLQSGPQTLNPEPKSAPLEVWRDHAGRFMSQYDVLCIGNAIVDIIARCDEKFLVDHGIIKGAMNLIDSHMGPAIEASGGSAGNTAAGIASLGGKAAFFGKVAKDQLGDIYYHDIRAQGVAFDTRPLEKHPPTARSMIFVTPDGERSMNTYLGACVELGPEDVEEDKARGAKVTYFEGYLWDPPRAKEAIRLTARHAHAAGRQVSMTLSDSFCVDRYRDEFLDLMRSGTVDIVFANSHEIKSLYQTSSFEEALAQIRKDCKIAAVTRSEKGSVIVRGDETFVIEATKIREVVDTTGAGDLYAAGFLFGYTMGLDLKVCGDLGSLAAGLVIQQIGPRPRENLRDAAIQAGLL
jgi:sugar/nucleoside kinase (ribokinase family)